MYEGEDYMAKWLDISVSLPNVKRGINPSIVRKRLAATSDTAPTNLKISTEIFNYNSTGTPLSGLSPFRFGGGSVCHFYAIGDDAVGLLNNEGDKVIKLLEMSYDTKLFEQRKVSPYCVTHTNRLLHYRIPMMVLQQSPIQYRQIMSMDSSGKDAFVQEKIKAGLEQHFRFLGLPVEIDSSETVFGDVSITGDIHPVEVKPGVWFLAAREISFRTNLDLEGIFHVGHLVSRGYGQIFKGMRRC